MRLNAFVALNALAGVVVASPGSALHARQAADLESFILKEKSTALQGVLNNFGPNGNLSRGAAPGEIHAFFQSLLGFINSLNKY
jgi:glucoamylase